MQQHYINIGKKIYPLLQVMVPTNEASKHYVENYCRTVWERWSSSKMTNGLKSIINRVKVINMSTLWPHKKINNWQFILYKLLVYDSMKFMVSIIVNCKTFTDQLKEAHASCGVWLSNITMNLGCLLRKINVFWLKHIPKCGYTRNTTRHIE